MFQSFTFLSAPPVANILSVGDHLTAYTSPSWALCKVYKHLMYEIARHLHAFSLLHKYYVNKDSIAQCMKISQDKN